MKLLTLFVFLFTTALYAQAPEKHPRVLEVEEKLRDEASRYFTLKHPGTPFFVKVDVLPLRRVTAKREDSEKLPYFDSVSEEDMDEWDDPTTPLSFLRHRVTKVNLEFSVPDNFAEDEILRMKEELTATLKLMPYRDEVRVEPKLKSTAAPMLPPFFLPVAGGILLSLFVLAALLRWSLGGKGASPGAAAALPAQVASPAAFAPAPERSAKAVSGRTSADVRGDVNFHDPLKFIDMVNAKIDLIKKSDTFPTLKDLMKLHAIGLQSPATLGGILQALPVEWQKEAFALGKGEHWLEAFAENFPVDQEALVQLDRISRDRQFSAMNRDTESVLIQLWRMEERSLPFLRKLNPDEALSILQLMPKSVSLKLAKKAFPGGWGRILENESTQLVLTKDISRNWMNELLLLFPKTEWKTLEAYRKDREILAYLDEASVEEEKDIYESLAGDSFVHSVRPAFYKVFELPDAEFTLAVSRYPLEKWALVVMNSSRTYLRRVTDALDDKKKVILSQHLRNLDLSYSREEQARWRKTMAHDLKNREATNTISTGKETQTDYVKTA